MFETEEGKIEEGNIKKRLKYLFPLEKLVQESYLIKLRKKKAC